METAIPPTFSSLGVCQELLDACERLNYHTPTPIQAESLPYTLKGFLFFYPSNFHKLII